ncbi:MAG TPA: response regulator [Steroidobacteraceae bacterium]|jgi:light-regulated signal transduction histidine kinase (bacteriophytochrome)|nr:response regulator [Steroidobacteraceae bacterium]
MTASNGVGVQPGARIMVVEDERILALDLAETLDELGYTVVGVASRGEEAIELAGRLDPQLILMDVRLAGEIDGITAAETIRREHDVPVVFLTAHADDDTLHRATSSDASAYLVKPFKPPDLRCVIEIALHKHAADVRLRENERWLEQTLQQRTAALEAANRELEAFNYSVAHDLRAPLRGIDSFSQLLIERYSQRLDSEGVGYLNRVRAAASRMSQLIDALLSLAQIGRGQLQPLDLDFSQLVQSVASEVAAANPDRSVPVVVAPGMRAYADPRLLRIVVANLLENAWKFTARRQRPAVEVGPCQNTSLPTYYVRDNGAGFDPAYASKLFGAFQRLHAEREFPGTGIGLAIVQRVITRHGGTIWAQSQPGEGATFFFSLPRQR